MSYVMTNVEFVKKLNDIVSNYKTLYVMGCFGAPMNTKNQKRYSTNTAYNRRAERTKIIYAADDETFGFDCVCLVKGVLWGWDGDKNRTYGGATYASNDVPDTSTEGMIAKCSDIGTKFDVATMVPGELVWQKGHVGIYIGDGHVIECSPAFKNCVQITRFVEENSDIPLRNTWKKHGKLPWINYGDVEAEVTAIIPTVLEWQKAAIADGFKFPKYGADGEWGSECAGVATKAIVKKRWRYTNKNLTKIVQRVVGVKVDGLCGKDTRNAIIAYQKKNGLTADGEVGINTWKKILGIK